MNKTALLTAMFALVLSACTGKEEHSNQPNVLIIVADDLGYGDVSCYSNAVFKTPNIDKLASEGVLFTNFYAPTPYCAPSRATLLTGRFPLRHGLVKNPAPDAGINDIGISSDETTLAEVLQQANYETMCIGKWHLGHKEEFFPVNHGFDHYYGILYSNDMRPVQIIEDRDTVEYPVDQRLLTQKYTNKALGFLQENRNKPFFLHLCHAMPHKPLAASKDFYTPETPNDLYNDVINELDWSVGKIINELKELNILKNTIVLFMSDNGPYYGGSTGGLKGMKGTDWEGGLRVPFMVYYPKAFKGNKQIDIPCWSADIYPTILSLTGIESTNPNYLDGENITEIIKGNQTEHKPIFGMHNSTIISVRKGDWKLYVNKPKQHRNVDISTWSDPRAPDGKTILAPEEQATPAQYPGLIPISLDGDIHLYNLKDDPGEQDDLWEHQTEKVKELTAEYLEFKKSLKLN